MSQVKPCLNFLTSHRALKSKGKNGQPSVLTVPWGSRIRHSFRRDPSFTQSRKAPSFIDAVTLVHFQEFQPNEYKSKTHNFPIFTYRNINSLVMNEMLTLKHSTFSSRITALKQRYVSPAKMK